MQSYKPYLKRYARNLRTTMTDAEILLWHHLRNRNLLGLCFLRQKPLGPFIVDFFNPQTKVAIEIDGNQHMASDQAVDNDTHRDAYLNRRGIMVMRFSNYEIFCATDAVIERIWGVVYERDRREENIPRALRAPFKGGRRGVSPLKERKPRTSP